MATAFDHHVDPFLYENLKLAGDGLVPAAWLDNHARHARGNREEWRFYFSPSFCAFTKSLRPKACPLIPFKGPVLGWLAFGNLTRRRFLDLDFFVPQKHMPRAAALLNPPVLSGNLNRLDELTGRAGLCPRPIWFFPGSHANSG